MSIDSPKPYHQMTLQEYRATDDAKRIPRSSIAALPPNEYTPERLGKFDNAHLKTLAQLWGIPQNGNKPELVRRILRRKEFREQLSGHTIESLCGLSRKELTELAKEARLFYSALNKGQIAHQLIAWRSAERSRVEGQIAEARHFYIVRKALISGLSVAVENLERYGLDEDGRDERQIFGVPRSIAARRAPQAVAAARELSRAEFLSWVKDHPEQAGAANLIAAGTMYDHGALFWRLVQKAFEVEPQGNLFSNT